MIILRYESYSKQEIDSYNGIIYNTMLPDNYIIHYMVHKNKLVQLSFINSKFVDKNKLFKNENEKIINILNDMVSIIFAKKILLKESHNFDIFSIKNNKIIRTIKLK